MYYSGLYWNEEGKKVGRNTRSVSDLNTRAGNGLWPYPGLRKLIKVVSFWILC
jgi:hypothetical protein